MKARFTLAKSLPHAFLPHFSVMGRTDLNPFHGSSGGGRFPPPLSSSKESRL